MDPNGATPPFDAAPAGGSGPAEAQELQLRYQELFEFAYDGYLVTDRQGVIREANYAAAALLDCPKDFLVGKPLGLFVAEGQRRAFYDYLLRRAYAETLETRLRRPGREPRDVLMNAAAFPGSGGELAGYRWALRDVTAARRAEQELIAERQLLDRVVDAVEAVILVVDTNGRVLRSNPYLHVISGHGAFDLGGRLWYEVLIPTAEQPAARRLVSDAAAPGTVRAGELPFQARSGRQRVVNWTARALDTGEVVLLGHDVTELHEAQRQALQAERLAAIGAVAAGLAHESRNALQRAQACLSMLEMRLRGQPEALDLLARVQRAQDDLHRLYEGVREYAAPLRLDRAPCDLGAVWREAWDDVSWRPQWQGAELREQTGGEDLRVAGDRFHLKRVFRNLLDNALASGAEPLRVEVRAEGAYLGPCPAVRVRVRDNGPGFPPGQQAKLFEPFFTTKPHGTGLGLSICRRVIEAHGGRIEVAEGDGPGAEIVITLPRRSP